MLLGPVSIAVRAYEAFDADDDNLFSTAISETLKDGAELRAMLEDTGVCSSLGMDKKGILAEKRSWFSG